MAANWAGQQIEPGAVVWRGARDGNLSSFKIGVVEAIGVDPNKARVRWVAEAGWRGDARLINSVGRPSIDSLALVDPSTLSNTIREALEQ
ncbi:hypothetical protein I5H06_gp43 [Mycobacterium phage SirPhilip]|uniref:Uncharacterized protein n=1 Tax=Mycobacterium phage SirPhilip TaxID=2015824 RepID=A0A222ZM58_9CAUD|nr:hypothetical protein I5H06_gp43 [Mycobacterium phage SirPhilip]ASR85261.1 hypothetical protein SEA_SIRPHILIP_59 [Mycobacterium phage SirPhilip]